MLSDESLTQIVVFTCQHPFDTLTLTSLRAVSSSWRRGVRSALRIPSVRQSLGCHIFDGYHVFRQTPECENLEYEFRAGGWCGSVLVCWCQKERDQYDKATGSDDYLVLFDDFAVELRHWSISGVFPEAYGDNYVLCVGADRFLAAVVGEFCAHPCSGVSEWNLQGELHRIIRLSWDSPVLAELENEDVDLLFSGGDLSVDAQVVVAGKADIEGPCIRFFSNSGALQWTSNIPATSASFTGGGHILVHAANHLVHDPRVWIFTCNGSLLAQVSIGQTYKPNDRPFLKILQLPGYENRYVSNGHSIFDLLMLEDGSEWEPLCHLQAGNGMSNVCISSLPDGSILRRSFQDSWNSSRAQGFNSVLEGFSPNVVLGHGLRSYTLRRRSVVNHNSCIGDMPSPDGCVMCSLGPEEGLRLGKAAVLYF